MGRFWTVGLLVLELGRVDTRVRDVATLLDGVFLGDTRCVLEEDNVLVVLDELQGVSTATIPRVLHTRTEEATHKTITVRLVERDEHVLL